MIIELFLVLFLGSCFLVIFEDDLIHALVFLGLSSLFLVVLIYLYKAPDVALTMGVVSSAATTILFIAVIKKLEGIGYER